MLSKRLQKIDKIVLPTNWPVGPVNVYLIYGEKITLVDTGLKNEQSWKELNQNLFEKGLSITDIDQILLTHHHNDHTGLLEWIINKHPIPVFAHGNVQPFLQGEPNFIRWNKDFFTNLYTEFGVPVELTHYPVANMKGQNSLPNMKLTKELKDGDEVPGLSGWKVMETKGHSQDHISLYCPEDQILICGDHVIKGISSGIFMDPPNFGEERARPLIQYIKNLKRCLKLPIVHTLSGHGPVIDNLAEVAHEQLNRIENRVVRVKKVLEQSSKTGYEIIKEMYPKRYGKSLSLFVSDIVSILDLLQARHEVYAEKRKGIYIYHLIR